MFSNQALQTLGSVLPQGWQYFYQVSLDFIFSAVSCDVTGPVKAFGYLRKNICFSKAIVFFKHLFTEKPTLKPHSCFLTRNKGFTIFYDHCLVYMATVSHSSWYAAFEWNCRKWFPSLSEISDKTLTSPRDCCLPEMVFSVKGLFWHCPSEENLSFMDVSLCVTHYWHKIIRPQVQVNFVDI